MPDVYYRRYTELPSLIHMLTHRQLTLLDPRSWDDRNDSYFLSLYRERKKLKSLLALCFTQDGETYHHWRVFASGSAGVSVTFNGTALRAMIRSTPSVQIRPVKYMTLASLRDHRLKTGSLPFLKRFAFKPEREIRILWESTSEERTSLPIPFDLSAISRITLSPWLHPSLSTEVKELLRAIAGGHRIPIYRSTLISNAEWMKFGATAK